MLSTLVACKIQRETNDHISDAVYTTKINHIFPSVPPNIFISMPGVVMEPI